jgi:hypothetical protein
MQLATCPAKPDPATAEQVCGACAHFEPARGEPAGNPKYGYCGPQVKLANERSLRSPDIHLRDVTTVCSMVRSPANAPAFESKEAPNETT